MSNKLLLAIDIGNTTIACGVSNDGKTWEEVRFATRRDYTVEALNEELCQIQRKPDSIAISSVVPQIDMHITQSCKEVFGVEPTFYTSSNIPLKAILYSPPTGVGADRLVNAFAVSLYYSLPAIIIDLGTATTFCAIDVGPTYVGGSIAAGITTSADALFAKASRLSEVTLAYPSSAVGKNLSESISSGILIGHCAMIEGMIARFSKEFTQKPMTILTGGWSKTLGKTLEGVVDVVDEWLLYKGLWALTSL